jgi:hypothetical protein
MIPKHYAAMSRDDEYQTIQPRTVCSYVYNRYTGRLSGSMCVLREVVWTQLAVRKYSSPSSVTIFPIPMRYRMNFSSHSCNYGIFIVWNLYNKWMSVTTNSAGRRAVLQTLEEDADDVADGGLWFQQHGVIEHTAQQLIACFERHVPWMYHFIFW